MESRHVRLSFILPNNFPIISSNIKAQAPYLINMAFKKLALPARLGYIFLSFTIFFIDKALGIIGKITASTLCGRILIGNRPASSASCPKDTLTAFP
jgi:hypothetical protein